MTGARRPSSEVGAAIRPEVHTHPIDRAIARLASRQYGVVSRMQLLALGLKPGAIKRRIQSGRLHVLYRGVYAVGHTRIPQEGRWLAAVLACGERAVLSHRSAAALWGIRRYTGKPEVTAPHAHRRGSLLVVSRSSITPAECTVHRDIPCTTPERTLIDFATVAQPHEIDRAVREAEFLRIVDFARLGAMLDGRRRMQPLREAIAHAASSPAHTRRAGRPLPNPRPGCKPANAGIQRNAGAGCRDHRGRRALAKRTDHRRAGRLAVTWHTDPVRGGSPTRPGSCGGRLSGAAVHVVGPRRDRSAEAATHRRQAATIRSPSIRRSTRLNPAAAARSSTSVKVHGFISKR